LIASVRASTRSFTAILCYDDGSIDDTVTVARGLGLEIITGNANAGVAHARNQLAAAARTEWIKFYDADDVLDARLLELLAPWCDDRHDVVTCDADWLNDSGDEVLLRWRYDPLALAREPFGYLISHPMSLNNSVIRRSAWLEVGGCDESLTMWEDADVHVRLARAGARIHHEPRVLSTSIRRAESFSHDYRRSWACRVAVLERYAADQHAEQITSVLADEAEHAAAELTFHDDQAGARRAIALCRRLGRRVPSTNNPVLKLLKHVVPAHVLLRLQVQRRRRAVASSS
jgi:glycosyltransferase involved in cell wall biosynthesis